MKWIALMVLLPGIGFAECREGYSPTDVAGVCQEGLSTETDPALVSDEQPPEEKMPSWQREGVTVIEAPSVIDQDKEWMAQHKQADKTAGEP